MRPSWMLLGLLHAVWHAWRVAAPSEATPSSAHTRNSGAARRVVRACRRNPSLGVAVHSGSVMRHPACVASLTSAAHVCVPLCAGFLLEAPAAECSTACVPALTHRRRCASSSLRASHSHCVVTRHAGVDGHARAAKRQAQEDANRVELASERGGPPLRPTTHPATNGGMHSNMRGNYSTHDPGTRNHCARSACSHTPSIHARPRWRSPFRHFLAAYA